MAALILDSFDRGSATGRKLRQYCEDRSDELLFQLEKSADHAATEKIRGRLAEIREIESKMKEPPSFRPVSGS